MADLTYEPWTYYNLVIRCITAGDDTPEHVGRCVNYGIERPKNQVYSNAGLPRVVCGKCSHDMEILSAVKMDPQPEVS